MILIAMIGSTIFSAEQGRINILMRTNMPLQLSLNRYFMHILSIQSYHLLKTVGKNTCKRSSGTP